MIYLYIKCTFHTLELQQMAYLKTKATTMASRQMPMKRKSPCAPCDPFLICLTPQNWVPQMVLVWRFGFLWGNFRFSHAPKPSLSELISSKATALHWICKAGLNRCSRFGVFAYKLPMCHASMPCLRDASRPTSQTIWNLLRSSTSPFARSLGP